MTLGEARPACRYGEKCYRKNPDHRRQFSHPGDADHPDALAAGGLAAAEAEETLAALDAAASSPAADAAAEMAADADAAAAADAVTHSHDPYAASSDRDPLRVLLAAPAASRGHAVRFGRFDSDASLRREDSASAGAAGAFNWHTMEYEGGRDEEQSRPPAAAADEPADEPAHEPAYEPEPDAQSDISAAEKGSATHEWPEDNTEAKRRFWRRGAGCVCVFAIVLSSCITGITALVSLVNLREDEQLVVPTQYGEWVRNGPGSLILWPHMQPQGHEVQKVPRLAPLEWAVLKHSRTQELRHIAGPGLLFREALEEIWLILPKSQLQKTQYHRLVHTLTGEQRIVRGPAVYVREPFEAIANGTEEALMVNAQEAVVVENRTSGLLRLISEPGLFYPRPYEYFVRWNYAILIEEQFYALVKNRLESMVIVKEGPRLLMLDPYEELVGVRQKIVVRKDEYLRLFDRRDGTERVVAGPAAVSPAFEEDMPDGVTQAALLTPNTAAVLLDRSTGQRELRTSEGLLMPEAYQDILEVRSKIRVLSNQALITRSPTGALTLHSGSSLFLGPYDAMFSMMWSVYNGSNVEPAPKEEVTFIDLRTERLPWTYTVATADNVRLQLTGSTLWRVTNAMTMAGMCEDARGDVFQRSRAVLLSALGRVKLQDFMSRIAAVADEVTQVLRTDPFVTQRGLKVLALTVTRIEPLDASVAESLNSMIVEVVNHEVRMEAALTERAVSMSELTGTLRLETIRRDLITAKAQNDLLLAIGEGRAEGARMVAEAQAFLDGLDQSVQDGASRIDLYRKYQEEDAVNNLTELFAGGPSHLYLHANDTEIILYKAMRRNPAGAPTVCQADPSSNSPACAAG